MYKDIKEQYLKAIQEKNVDALMQILQAKVSSDLPKEDQSNIHIMKAEGYSFVGKWVPMDEEFNMGYDLANYDKQYLIKLQWALSHMLRLKRHKELKYHKYAFLRITEILNSSEKDYINLNEKEYAALTNASILAFGDIYLENTESAIKRFENIAFTPIPLEMFNDKNSLQFLFNNIYKGFAVAIELKNKELLLNLIKVISIDDQMLNGNDDLFTKYYSSLLHLFDLRPEFVQEFNSLFHLKDELSTKFKNFFYYLYLIEENNLPKLKSMFDSFK